KTNSAVASMDENFPLSRFNRENFPGEGPVMFGGVDIHKDNNVVELLRPKKGPGGDWYRSSWDDNFPGRMTSYVFDDATKLKDGELTARIQDLMHTVVLERQLFLGMRMAFQGLLYQSRKESNYDNWILFQVSAKGIGAMRCTVHFR
ncbi:hypothetical protein TrCOL_g13043, partial [Triparma columacea]